MTAYAAQIEDVVESARYAINIVLLWLVLVISPRPPRSESECAGKSKQASQPASWADNGSWMLLVRYMRAYLSSCSSVIGCFTTSVSQPETNIRTQTHCVRFSVCATADCFHGYNCKNARPRIIHNNHFFSFFSLWFQAARIVIRARARNGEKFCSFRIFHSVFNWKRKLVSYCNDRPRGPI